MSKEYQELLKSKVKKIIDSGFKIKQNQLNEMLFDFQKHIVTLAILKGRFAIFADCGLGKTFMQLEWSNQVSKKTKKPVLILAPLTVVAQTIREGERFGIKVVKASFDKHSQIKFEF